MNISPYGLALIAGGFAIIGALIGAWGTYRFSLNLMRRQDFNKAAVSFRNAFLPETTFLRHNANIGTLASTNDLGECLGSAYVRRHLKAFEIFRNHLSAKDRVGINNAWKEYCKRPDNPETLYFEQYSSKKATDTQERERELKKLALDKIEELLKFAENK